MIIELRRGPFKRGRYTYHSAEVGRTAGFALVTRGATGSDLMESADTLSAALELGDCLGQSVHAHRKGGDGSEEDLELHDWIDDEAFGKTAWFVFVDEMGDG